MLRTQQPLRCCGSRKSGPAPGRPCARRSAQLSVSAFKSSPGSPQPPTESRESSQAGVDFGFKKSIEVMLNRAASSLTRGTCTCLSCRGDGAVECPHCKGSGVLSNVAAERAGLLRGALLKLRTAVGMPSQDVPYNSSQWMRTNRCPRCHGVGRLACEPCSGSGLRYPHQPGRRE